MAGRNVSLGVGEQYTPEGMAKFGHIYEFLKPYMRAYRKEILDCWEGVTEDHKVEECVFTLQRIPLNPDDIKYQTTCGHLYCSSKHGIMEPGTYRVSIEKRSHFNLGKTCTENADSESSDAESPNSESTNSSSSAAESRWITEIPLEPLHKWSLQWARWPNARAMKGKGKGVKHWLCLTCLEDLWLEGTGFDDDNKDEQHSQIPTISDLSILRPETRTGGAKNKLYNLPSPQVYALHKWAAVIRYHDFYLDPLHDSIAARCFPGAEPETLYEDIETRDLHGIDEETGVTVEIPAHETKGKLLSDVLAWVDDQVDRARREFRAQDDVARDAVPVATEHASDDGPG